MHLQQNFRSSWLMHYGANKGIFALMPPPSLSARRVTRVEYESECAWQEIKMPMRSSCVTFPPVWHTLSTPMSVSKHSISLQPRTRERQKDFYQNIFLPSQSMKITLPHPLIFMPRLWSSYIQGCMFGEYVIWIFIEHMLFANDSEFDQEIVYLKSSQSQILRDFCHWACSLDMNLVYGSLVMHREYEIWLSACGKCF